MTAARVSGRLLLALVLAVVPLALPALSTRVLTGPCQTGGWPDYSPFLQLNTPSLDCGGSKNEDCDGCFDYRTYAKPVGTGWAYSVRPNPGTPPDVSNLEHVLVLPAPPCRGVEEWSSKPGCGGEGIWDAAWALLTTGSLKSSKALAINPTSRRTQHQMHVHVANLDPSLQTFLSKSVTVGASTWTYADCKGVPLSACKVSTSATPIRAKCVAKPSPSLAAPFATTYTSSNAVAKTTTLVYSPKGGVFCVVQATDRPAECLLQCKSDCQTKTGIKCP